MTVLKIVQAPTAVAFTLCLVGGTRAPSPAQMNSETAIQAGNILYTFVVVTLVVLTFQVGCAWRMTSRGQGMLITSVMAALPFILVLMIYSLLATFTHDSRFNAVSGSLMIKMVMGILPEAIAACIYITCGLKLPNAVPEKDASDIPTANSAYPTGSGDFGDRDSKLALLDLAEVTVSEVAGEKNDDMEHEV
jgi:hypothetical protein